MKTTWEYKFADVAVVSSAHYMPFQSKPFGYEGEGGDGDTGDGDTGDGDKTTFTKAELDAQIEAAKAAAAADFDAKKKELLEEAKKAKNKAKQWENFDFEEVSRMMKLFGENEEARVLADGKVEEVIEKRTDRLRAEFEDQKKNLSTELETTRAERDNFKNLYESKLTDIQIRAAAEKAGVVPTAIDDVVSRGQKIFRVDETGTLEARDANGDLMKTESGLLLSTELFIESLRTSAPHYWPAGQGSGGSGSTGAKGTGSIDERMAAAAKRGDMAEYARLRAEKHKSAGQ